VVGDTNGDGVLSPGETAGLKVQIANGGSATALGIKGTLSSSTPGVSIQSGSNLDFGDISGGGSACGDTGNGSSGYCGTGYGSGAFPQVTVVSSVSAGTSSAFSLALTDIHGNAFTINFTYTTR